MADNSNETTKTETPGSKSYPDSESLLIYYKQLADSEPLSAADESALWQKLHIHNEAIRMIFGRFAYIMAEHIRIFRNVTPEDITEHFNLGRSSNGQYPIAELSAHTRAMEELTGKLEAAFRKKNTRSLRKLRQDAAALLARFPAHVNKLYEWQSVANAFRNRLNAAETTQEERDVICQSLLLDETEFLASMEELDQAFQNMDEVRQQILTANLRLVVSIVQHFRCNNIQTGDLIQEGNLGLIHAMERFDYTLGHRFATYATWWIKRSITNAIAAQSRIIRLPAHMLSAISRINRAERNFIQDHGRIPEVEELAAVLEMPRERVNAIRKMAAQAISIHAPVSHDLDAPEIEQFLCDENDDGPVRQLAFRFLKDRLGQALEHLTERERQIIKLRFGLSGNRALSLNELSEVFGLTRERVRQLEMRALRKLRDPKMSDYFQDYFL